MNAIVADHMATNPILIRADASLTDAAELMDRHHVHGVPVVDHAGVLVGVLSQSDLNRARSTEYLWVNWPGLAVRHLMTVLDDHEPVDLVLLHLSRRDDQRRRAMDGDRGAGHGIQFHAMPCPGFWSRRFFNQKIGLFLIRSVFDDSDPRIRRSLLVNHILFLKLQTTDIVQPQSDVDNAWL